MSGATPDSAGGGINNAGTLTLHITLVDNCGAISGGGIYNSGSLALHASKVTGNDDGPDFGSGIFNTSPGT